MPSLETMPALYCKLHSRPGFYHSQLEIRFYFRKHGMHFPRGNIVKYRGVESKLKQGMWEFEEGPLQKMGFGLTVLE